LALSQSAGVNLYLHATLHTGKSIAVTTNGTTVKFSCSCTDDFHMPYEKPAEQVQIEKTTTSEIIAISPVSFHIQANHFSLHLRGPPAFIG
jgi:hypothetical protein